MARRLVYCRDQYGPSNTSLFGISVRHNLAPYGWDGWAVVAQLESQVDIAAAPNERAAFGTRDSFLGLQGPWGAIKAGKTDTPYKKSTASMDPFSRTLGDYNSIMAIPAETTAPSSIGA